MLDEAVRRHQSGQLAEAESLYHRVLSIEPANAASHHLLGVLAYQGGRLELAAERIGKALAARPDFAEAHGTLGLVLKRQGRLAEAVDCFARAIALRPDYAEAFNNLADSLRLQGRLEEAVAASRQAVMLKPRLPEAHANLGVTLVALGRLDEAVAAFATALRHRPDDPDLLANLANACFSQGRHEDAVAAYRRALLLRPHFPEASADLGGALRALGRRDEAIAAYRSALDQRPAFAQALGNLSAVLFEVGRYDEAVDSARKALALAPHDAEAWFNLGNALLARGQRDEATGCYVKALDLKPGHPEALGNLGKVLQEQGRLDEAIACFRQALALRPDLPRIHNNLGSLLTSQGRLDEAIAAYRSALALAPDIWQAWSNLLMSLHYSERLFAQEHARTVQGYADRMAPRAIARTFPNAPDPGRRLRVGYVSGDLGGHPVGYFLSCFLPAHGRSEVEVFCYSNATASDSITAHLRASADHWRTIDGQSDAEVDALIRRDGIDILVDLSGHTARNRLPVFAGRAAPVQVTALGYFGTTGLAAMDYILADRFVVPPGEEGLFTEKVWRLPDSYICFAPPAFDIPVQVRPAGELVLGCFNNWSKVSDGAIALWATVLREVPDSRLLLKTRFLDNPEMRRLALQRFASHRVDPARLVLEGPSPRAELLAAYNRIDIALDPLPFGGGATTAEALWMGVPVVSLRGDRWVSRVAESILAAVGRPDLVAGDARAYVELVRRLAGDPATRGELRRSLRTTVLNSPLCDGRRYAAALDAAYRTMWRDWCAAQGSTEAHVRL